MDAVSEEKKTSACWHVQYYTLVVETLWAGCCFVTHLLVVVCLFVGTAPLFAPSYLILRQYSRKWWWTETKNLRYIFRGEKSSITCSLCLHKHSLHSCFSAANRKSVHTDARTHWTLQYYPCDRKHCPQAKLLTWAGSQQRLQCFHSGRIHQGHLQSNLKQAETVLFHWPLLVDQGLLCVCQVCELCCTCTDLSITLYHCSLGRTQTTRGQQKQDFQLLLK